jgi:tetratricopeptide (TPR) repeat protein
MGTPNIMWTRKILAFSRRNALFFAGVSALSLIAGLLLTRHSTSGMDHARLANDYIAQRKVKQALDELKEAERLGSTNGFEFEASLFQAYSNLHEVEPAVKHGRKCIELGKASGVKSETIDSIQWWCRDFESRLVPTYLEVAAPTDYSAQEFNKALCQKLSPEEVKSAVNPLASTSPMDSWGHGLTAGAKDDLEKARMLFEGLIHRLDGQEMRPLTAEEVFANWNNPEVSFHCEEYAFLYTSLARAVGLKAFAVVVEETCYGEKTDHACAAVFLGKKALLVDPSYFWFGAPHKRFQVLDDVQAAALYLSTFADLKKAQIACKLAPALPQAYSDLFCSLTHEGKWSEAKEVLHKFEELDHDSWGTACNKAIIAIHEKKYDEAASLSSRAIGINPSCGPAYVCLGSTLEQLHKFDEAKEAFQKALRCPLDTQTAVETRKQIAWLVGAKDVSKQ